MLLVFLLLPMMVTVTCLLPLTRHYIDLFMAHFSLRWHKLGHISFFTVFILCVVSRTTLCTYLVLNKCKHQSTKNSENVQKKKVKKLTQKWLVSLCYVPVLLNKRYLPEECKCHESHMTMLFLLTTSICVIHTHTYTHNYGRNGQ